MDPSLTPRGTPFEGPLADVPTLELNIRLLGIEELEDAIMDRAAHNLEVFFAEQGITGIQVSPTGANNGWHPDDPQDTVWEVTCTDPSAYPHWPSDGLLALTRIPGIQARGEAVLEIEVDHATTMRVMADQMAEWQPLVEESEDQLLPELARRVGAYLYRMSESSLHAEVNSYRNADWTPGASAAMWSLSPIGGEPVPAAWRTVLSSLPQIKILDQHSSDLVLVIEVQNGTGIPEEDERPLEAVLDAIRARISGHSEGAGVV